MKKNFITFSILFLFLLMLSFPAVTKEAASTGLNLWIYTVLPALLPYTIISSLLLYLDAFRLPCRIFEKLFHKRLPESETLIIICGCLCGCPIGAKLAADSYKSGKISKRNAEFLMCTCNNLSPSFLINYVFAEVYTPFLQLTTAHKWLLCFIIFASSFCGAAITFRLIYRPGKSADSVSENDTYRTTPSKNKKKPSFSKFFEECILSSFEIQAKIGGYIILFTIINNLFLFTLKLSDIQSAVFGSILEVTSGMGVFLSLNNAALNLSSHAICAVITSLTAFGGLCTIFQTKTVISDSGLSVKKYGISKAISGILAFMAAFLFA